MSSTRRVLHVLPWVSSGGVERRRLELARHLPKDRWEQRVVCLEQGKLFREFSEARVSVTQLGGTGAPTDWRTVRRVAEVVREFRPDIVHGAVFEGMTMATLGGRLGGARTVLVEETSDGVSRSWRAWRLLQTWARLSTHVVAVSDTVAEQLVRHARIPRERITVVRNGVSMPERPSAEALIRARERWRLEPEDQIVVSIGRVFDSPKRFSDLLRAVALLQPRHPRLRLLIVGAGPDLDALSALAVELGIADRVRFVGYLSHVGEALSLADCFTLLSERESFGLALVEAMHYGLPCVTTEVGGMREILLHEETGLFVPPRAPAAAAAALERLLLDAPLRRRLGEAGQRRAADNMSQRSYVPAVEALYQRMLSR